MKIHSEDFRVRPGEEITLGERRTIVEPFCKSKKVYQKLLGEHMTYKSCVFSERYS